MSDSARAVVGQPFTLNVLENDELGIPPASVVLMSLVMPDCSGLTAFNGFVAGVPEVAGTCQGMYTIGYLQDWSTFSSASFTIEISAP